MTVACRSCWPARLGHLVGARSGELPAGTASRPLVAATVAGLLLGNRRRAAGRHGARTLCARCAADRRGALPGLQRGGGGRRRRCRGCGPRNARRRSPGWSGCRWRRSGLDAAELRRRNAVSVQRRLERVAAGEHGRSGSCSATASCATRCARWRSPSSASLFALLVARVPWAIFRTRAALLGGPGRRTGGGAGRRDAERAATGARRRWLAVGLAARPPRGADPVKPRTEALLRLFGVQASWTYERMAGIGVGHAAAPLLRERYAASPSAASATRRWRVRPTSSIRIPYLAGVAVGAVVRAERDGVPGPVDLAPARPRCRGRSGRSATS